MLDDTGTGNFFDCYVSTVGSDEGTTIVEVLMLNR